MKKALKWLLEGFVDFFSDKTSTDVGIFQSFVGGILGIALGQLKLCHVIVLALS